MLKRILILLILALAQYGCYVSEENGGYKPADLTPDARQGLEWAKRELLTLEDLKVGDGPIAAWGRKTSADIEVRYTDGILLYRGPATAYFGMEGSVFIHNSVHERGMLSLQQDGIILGLNGMAVRGKRRITVSPNLVCYGGMIGQSVSQGANPNVTCNLVVGDRDIIKVRKEKLIVEATLTASCIPVFLDIVYVYRGEFRCRNADGPQRDPAVPVWHIY